MEYPRTLLVTACVCSLIVLMIFFQLFFALCSLSSFTVWSFSVLLCFPVCSLVHFLFFFVLVVASSSFVCRKKGEGLGQLLLHRHGRGSRAGAEHGRSVWHAEEGRAGEKRLVNCHDPTSRFRLDPFSLVVVIVAAVLCYVLAQSAGCLVSLCPGK